MPRINVIENGEIVSNRLYSHNVAIDTETVSDQFGEQALEGLNDTLFEPAIVQDIEYDEDNQTDSTTTVCGETETRRTEDGKADITIQGIVTESGKEVIKTLKQQDILRLISDVEKGQVIVKRATISQNAQLVSYQETGNSEEQLAFEFQLELKVP